MRPPSVCPLQVLSLIFGRLIPFLLLRPVIVPIKRLCPPQLLPLLEAAFVLFPPFPCFALSNVPMFPDLLYPTFQQFYLLVEFSGWRGWFKQKWQPDILG